jgi:hypothetical protein
MIGGFLDPRGRSRIETPLEHSPIDHERAGDLTVRSPLVAGPGVDEQRAPSLLLSGLLRLDPGYAAPRAVEDVVDGGRHARSV